MFIYHSKWFSLIGPSSRWTGSWFDVMLISDPSCRSCRYAIHVRLPARSRYASVIRSGSSPTSFLLMCASAWASLCVCCVMETGCSCVGVTDGWLNYVSSAVTGGYTQGMVQTHNLFCALYTLYIIWMSTSVQIHWMFPPSPVTPISV